MNLQGKRGVILGVLNKKSIAAACASMMISEGAQVICSYLPVSEDENRRHALATRAVPGISPDHVLPCDVTDDNSLRSFFDAVGEIFDNVDFIIHAVSFLPPEATANNLSALSREGFHASMDISVYSLMAVSGYAKQCMKNGGSIITFSYLSADAIVPGYEFLGVGKAALQAAVFSLARELGDINIRVNAISAPPFSSSSAIGNLFYRALCEKYTTKLAPAKIPSMEDIVNLSAFLVSDFSRGINGERIFVDGGFHNLSAAV